LFALTVTASVQLVGVYLVFASLILPALAVRVLDDRRGLVVGYVIGVVGYAVGVVASARLDLPTGPLIVFTLASAALLGAAAATYFSSSTRRAPSSPGTRRKGKVSDPRS
jgi:zinc/manganese transport system permease protein